MFMAGQVPPVPESMQAPSTEPIHMPAPSIFPLFVAIGLGLMGAGLVIGEWRILIIGGATLLLSAIAMGFEYPSYGQESHDLEEMAPSAGGVDLRKAGLWAFLGSECVFFASLIATYVVYKSRNVGGPGADILEIPLTSISTFALLMSSLAMVLALNAIQQNKKNLMRVWLAVTISLGLVFLGVEAYEFAHFYHEGLAMQTDLFGQSFFTLVGFHGFHVSIGVLWLATVWFASFSPKFDKSRALSVEMAGLYWHFVDIVWVIIFTLVYLMQQVKGA